MKQVFIAHADEDYPFVKTLAESLESFGYSCWFYERDSIAGHSYLVQVYEAIQAASAFLVVVSQDSLKSQHVTREIEQAYERGNLLVIPIRRNVTDQQMRDLQPLFSMAMGTAVYLNANENEVRSLPGQIRDSLVKESINPGPVPSCGPPRIPPPPPPRLGGIPHWASDFIQIRPQLAKEILFLNKKVRAIVEADRNFLFISGEKGLGKTLLLTYKRSLLTDTYCTNGNEEQPSSGIVFIPEGRPYLDLMANLASISKQHVNFLAKFSNCKRLWSFALRLSVLSYFPSKFDQLMDRGKRFSTVFDEFRAAGKQTPTHMFRELLSLSVNDINKLLDGFDNRLQRVFREFRQGTLIFIDKIDQGLGNLSKEAWINVQAGLLEAAWDCVSTNPHVKIYGTIREEAFANYESELRGNLQNAVLSLSYNEDDLRQMIDKLSRVYERVERFTEFVHMTTVRNNRTGVVEDCFAYMARHTIGRPRDLVLLCGKLSGNSDHLSEDVFRRTVNDTAANIVMRNVFSEMQVFLTALKRKEDREDFFRLIPYNVLTKVELESIADKFNGAYSSSNELHNEPLHPFCELWSCGLLGAVREDLLHAGKWIQVFKQPHEPGVGTYRCLPRADFYLLHPSLHAYVKGLRGNDGYNMISCIEIGHNRSWHDYYPRLIKLQQDLFALPENLTEVRDSIQRILPYLHAYFTEHSECFLRMPKLTLKSLQHCYEELEKAGYSQLSSQLVLDGFKDQWGFSKKKTSSEKKSSGRGKRHPRLS